jgi:NTE family protein
MTRIGLVLGAGGNVGQAYHAGVLTALEHDLGWDPRTAEVIVGTSAGSVVGTLLSLGVPASDLAANLVDVALSPDGSAVLEAVGRVDGPLPPLTMRTLLRGNWRPPSAGLVRQAVLRPWALRPDRVAMTLLPDGDLDLFDHAGDALRSLGSDWPPRLRICAARRSDSRRVVFGPGHSPAPLAQAVAASCAIPGYFAPVEIDGVRYFDGGVHSPTNADLLAGAGLDLVIVSSPMSSARGRGRGGLMAAARRDAHRRLAGEAAVLRKRGTAVVRFEPARRTQALMGGDALDTEQGPAIARAAFFEAGRWARHHRVAHLLEPVDRRRRGGSRSATR